ncbi:MAG: O-antigen ligase family protein [Methanobacterium sp.]|nr:O-antigen ligase family protein [Methanobacterium sp.]
MVQKIDKFLAFAILFINGWNWSLPVVLLEAMPIWFTPIQVVHGLFLYELLFLIYLVFLLVIRGGRVTIGKHDGSSIVFCIIIGLGCFGIVSNVINVQQLREIGESGRLFFLAAYFLVLIYWTKKHGPTFVLRTFLLGVAIAGLINIYYSYVIRFREIDGLFFLLGQNGPGGILGLSVVLSAWLMLERKSWIDVVVAILVCVVGLFAASISYSKLSILMACSGLVAWVFILLQLLFGHGSRKSSIVILIFLLSFLISNFRPIRQYVQSVNSFINNKFINSKRSVESRAQYFVTVSEILLHHPLFGVGSGGFYEAVIKTEGYHYKESCKEDIKSGKEGKSNPHNSFLYYAAANGFPGLFLCVFLFIMALHLFRKSLLSRGISGKILWCCLTFAYFIYGMTLPTLYNSIVLYLPIAFAIVVTNQQYLISPKNINFKKGY